MKVLNGEAPITGRPGALLPAADFATELAKAEKACGHKLDDDEFASYLMYPKVFTEHCASDRKYGPVSVLPTPVFFYGMAPEEERTIEIELGKALVVRLTTLGDTDEEGQVRVFFELNGQPRVIKVPNRSAVATRPARRKAEEGNANHVAAPMPGSISSIAVKPGQDVKIGDILLSIEAMKWRPRSPHREMERCGSCLSGRAAGRRKGFAGRNRLVVSRTGSSTAPRGPNWIARTRFCGTSRAPPYADTGQSISAIE